MRLPTSLFAAVILAATGCGGAEVKRVAGQVLASGQPVDKATVCFLPKDDIRLGVMVCHETASDGSFVTHPDPAYGEGRGGNYIVTITEPDLLAKLLIQCKEPRLKPIIRVPLRYAQQETSPLHVEIVKGNNDLDPFELQE